uniref:Uncharacterized protein n=1 Tax=Strongyloides venezuelensis TaxID=75913 RepID=A0A0K0FQH0_STRVS
MWLLTPIIENLPGKFRVAKFNVIMIAFNISTETPDFKIFCHRRMAKIRLRCKMLTGDIPVIRSLFNLQGYPCQFADIHCYCKPVMEASVFGQGKKRTHASSETYVFRTDDSYQKNLNQLINAGVPSFFNVKGVSHLGNLIKIPEDVSIDYYYSVLLKPFKEDMNKIAVGISH